jgi:SAM-dependent methyltransferase
VVVTGPNRKYCMELYKNQIYFGTGSDTPFTLDPYTGQRRRATYQDVKNLARLAEALPNIDFHMSLGIVQDSAVGTYDRWQYLAMLEGTNKPINVTAVDLDEVALETARENAELNAAAIDFRHADAFDFLREDKAAGRQWDVVVVDPSKFVPNRSLMETGLRKYADLNRLASGVVAPGGLLLTCSCSGLVDQATFVQTLARAARAAGRTKTLPMPAVSGDREASVQDSLGGVIQISCWSMLSASL